MTFKSWVGECRDVAPTKLKSQNIFKEHGGGGKGGEGGQDGCERRIKVFLGGSGLGVGMGEGVRVDVNREVKFL